MSLNPDIRDQAYQFFIEEAQELLQVLETGLLDLRQDHSTPKVHELMRAAHSIKGGAASVELSAIELLAHRLEDFFKALYSDSVNFDAELEGLLLQGYDCLRNPLTEQIESGTFDAETALLTAEPVFAALEIRLEEALKNADNYIPSANDLGVDIVSSIFEIDVAQSLEHLQTVVANPTSYDLAGELQGQLEVFAGFAELFNLSGLSEIIQTSQVALEQNPDRVLDIIQATIADCTIARELVLAGDRDRGGEVSPALKALAQSTTINDTEAISFTFDELVLDNQDNLWGSVEEPLAEDIFGVIPTPDIVSEPVLATDPDIDDIFGTIPDAESIVTEMTEEIPTSSNVDLDNIFGTIPESETVESTAEIDNLFETIPDAEPIVNEEIPESSNVDLDDIFGTIPESETVHETISTAEDLNNIFGTIPDTELTVTEASNNLTTEESTDVDNQPQVENIEAAVESITEMFDSLPRVENVSESLTLPIAETPTKKSQPEELSTTAKSTTNQPKVNTAAKLSVRVDLDRLERMNNLVGELTINRNSLALQNQQLQTNVSELGQKFLRFQELTQTLREISDKMLLEQRSNSLRNSVIAASHHQPYSTSNLVDESTEFDALEMDSYSTLYAALQEVLEEIVQLEESVDDITIFAKQSDRTINSQRQMLGQMRDELMWVRMLPLDQILQRFPRTLRDLASKYHKPVELKLTGTGVLVDKAVLEKLSDPLLHLLRNGFDHGIESAEMRKQQGKPAEGLIEIHAYYQGNQTVIEVKDDGKGLDLAKISEKAVQKGLISQQEAATATKERLYDLIFEPGFSTASKVSEISGRGVGMNIVRSQIETLKGKITVASTPGEGSTFTLRLPLTLTIAKLLVCSLGSTTFAIPSDSIAEIIIPTQKQIKIANHQKFLSLDNKLIPIYPLQDVLQYNCPVPEQDYSGKAFKTITPPQEWLAPLLLLKRGQEFFALEVASLLSEQELVIKPYGKAIAPPPYTYGCTILGDGSLIPALDGGALISAILGEEVNPVTSGFELTSELLELETANSDSVVLEETTTQNNLIGQIATSNKATSVKTIMVVDDSTALRRTMALTLEKQGYRVIQKKDGKEALDGFRQNPDLNLIICDIEMPTMNGFEFLGMRRRDTALSKIPTFMLTSRSGGKHRNLAMQLGANGYFTKPYIEQEFIAEVKKILTEQANSKNHKPSQASAPIKTKTILVIDDSSALRRTLALSLEKRGYRVLQGRDGMEGLQLLRQNLQTNLVICDIEMPNMNGFEFLTNRRQEPQLTKIPVVMLTSRSGEKHRSLATGLGANGYFTKPYIEDKFIPEIDKILQQFNY
jgi:chemotaxis family two-component system sensor histidine kinase/response regulator PixL